MSVRGIIIEEIYNRIAAAVPMAKVLVARDAEDEPADDGQLVTVIPQTEKPWEAADMNDLRSARQMALIVAVGYQPAVGADALTAWKKLEDLSETITDALLERVTEGREDSAAEMWFASRCCRATRPTAGWAAPMPTLYATARRARARDRRGPCWRCSPRTRRRAGERWAR